MKCPTPHNSANFGDFAKTVLMPGDPKRAAFIADEFLEKAALVNDVRGVCGYTGFYKGKRVSVMASGMGIPSIGIYAYELYKAYGVENIIRVGSAGALSGEVKLRDVVIAKGALTNSSFIKQFCKKEEHGCLLADAKLVESAENAARERNISYHLGNLFSTDIFYDEGRLSKRYAKKGALAVEMECAGLYVLASALKKRALAICTISDSLVTGESLSAKERQTSFLQMIELALEIAE